MQKIILVLFFTLSIFNSFSQSVGIGTTTPEAAAVLDIQSATKGVFLPRVTSTQRLAMNTGSGNGLLVYDINTASFWHYGDGDWNEIKATNNSEWIKYQDTLLYTTSKGVAIGSPVVNPSAALDISSATKGILIPRLTSAQRNALAATAVDGLLVFDADEVRFYYYTPGGWQGIGDYQIPYWVTTGNSSITTLNTQNVGIGTYYSSRPPQYKLDVEGRLRSRTSPQGTAGLWLDSVSGSNPNSFIGVLNDSSTGIWGQGAASWGLIQNTRTNNVGIGTTTPHKSAIMELSSTSKAFLPTRMTYSQMLSIPNPQAGMVAYDSDAKTLRVFNGSKWVRLSRKEEALQSSGVNNNATGTTYYGGDESSGLRVVDDASGNIYAAGVFKNTHSGFGLTADATFGPADIFLVKYNSSGALLWSRSIGSAYNDTLTGMEIGNDGNLYLLGQFSGVCNFGGNVLTANLLNDGFLSKWDASGNQVWTISFGGSVADFPDKAEDIALDNANNIYVTGSFFGVFNTSVSGINMTSLGGYDAFLIKINSAGALQWMRQSGGDYTDYGYYVEADQSGNIYTYGTGGGTVYAGSHYIYIPQPRNRRLRRVKTRVFRKALLRNISRSRIVYRTNPARQLTRSLVVDYLVCYQANTGTENYINRKYNIDAIKATTNGYYEVSQNMITKYNASSDALNRITMNNSVTILPNGVHIAPNNDIILLAYADVGSAISFVPIAPNAAGWIMMRLTATGNIVWSNQLQNSGSFNANAVRSNSSGTVFYYTGDFTGSMLLNNGTITSNISNMFVVKYQQ